MLLEKPGELLREAEVEDPVPAEGQVAALQGLVGMNLSRAYTLARLKRECPERNSHA